MKLYRYIDENRIERCPRFLESEDKIMSNPSEKTQREYGYTKTLVTEPYPDTPEGFYRVAKYTDGETAITKSWSEPIEEIITEEDTKQTEEVEE